MKKLWTFVVVAGIIGILVAMAFQVASLSSSPVGSPHRLREILAGCFWNHYEVLHIVIVGILVVGAMPIHKRAIQLKRMAGASKYTNLISLLGLFLSIRSGKEPKLSRPVFGTARIFGVLGRVNVIVFSAFVTYDITSIAICVIRIV